MWVQTISGRRVDLLDPDPASIDLDDIAVQLSRIVRFNGATAFPYSVAQHCATGASFLRHSGRPDAAALALRFLLHDAHEAYIGDIATPVAQIVCDGVWLRVVRWKLDKAIWLAATGQPWTSLNEIAASVHDIDIALLRAERDRLCATPPSSWGAAIETAEPLPVDIVEMSPREARETWLSLLAILKPGAK